MASDSTAALPHILIVDDDAALLEALPRMLRVRLPQVAIETCESADVARDLLSAKDYHVIISDVKMPGIGGIGLLREAAVMRPTTPFILITGHGDDTMAAEALGLGAYLFIQKPIDRDSFALCVQRGLEAYELRNRIEMQENTLGALQPQRTALVSFILSVDGLPSSYNAEDLKKLFSQFGTVLWTRLVTDIDRYSRQFGFVEMTSTDEATRAVTALDGCEIAGETIRVAFANNSAKPS